MLKLKRLFLISCAAALFHSCATTIPSIEACAPTGDGLEVAALCQDTNDDGHRRMNLNQWFDFIYAQPERPDPDHPGQMLPAKGPAIAVSSEDWAANEAAIAQLCIRGKCTYAQKRSVARELAFRHRILAANAKRMGKYALPLIRHNEALAAQVFAAQLAE